MYRDRIKELKRVKAGELSASPHNWRRHPEHQKEALRSVLDTVGYADAILVREVSTGYEIIDGHLRTSLDEEQMVPILVLDVNEDEAKRLLLTLDPIAALAESNEIQLASLINELPFDNDALNEMLAALQRTADSTPIDNSGGLSEFPLFDDDIETQYKCPSCQYVWSGAAK